MNNQLTQDAERLRKDIESILPDAREFDKKKPQEIYFSKDRQGNTIYAGSLLKEKAEKLVVEMNIGEGWGWKLAIFSEPRPIKNELKQMYLVPLSDNAVITRGSLEEGLKEKSFSYIKDSPVLNPGAAVIFIARA
ncbi:uncharacterized protein N7529_012163 [Penicillium soppii]|uniref:uncharacterized protein n=1 Tax=Penicillium soppii TaxID=69789 RepID=UPI002549577B|nr:uncharacterized protein N7529_012163 [Penicillium soppii]KAJ5852778.1 hypothetical protein N7529_012163 [Penicillium soppii]